MEAEIEIDPFIISKFGFFSLNQDQLTLLDTHKMTLRSHANKSVAEMFQHFSSNPYYPNHYPDLVVTLQEAASKESEMHVDSQMVAATSPSDPLGPYKHLQSETDLDQWRVYLRERFKDRVPDSSQLDQLVCLYEPVLTVLRDQHLQPDPVAAARQLSDDEFVAMVSESSLEEVVSILTQQEQQAPELKKQVRENMAREKEGLD